VLIDNTSSSYLIQFYSNTPYRMRHIFPGEAPFRKSSYNFTHSVNPTDIHCLLSRIFTTDCFSIVEVFTNGLLVIDLYNNRNTYNNSSCGMTELLSPCPVSTSSSCDFHRNHGFRPQSNPYGDIYVSVMGCQFTSRRTRHEYSEGTPNEDSKDNSHFLRNPLPRIPLDDLWVP
jgi:hypothetical protein